MDASASSSSLEKLDPRPSGRVLMPRGISIQPEAATPDLLDTPRTGTIPSSGSAPNVIHCKRVAIFIQDECLKHRFIRSRDTSGIFERPERLHAVKLGLAAAIARIEDAESTIKSQQLECVPPADTEDGDLAAALGRMAITSEASTAPVTGVSHASSNLDSSSTLRSPSITIRRTSASVSLLDHAAVKYVHGDIERDVYLENLIGWALDSQKNIMEKGTEIPERFPPLDLYLCPDSIDAIQGAIGAVCEAVDVCVATTRGSQLGVREPDDPCERAFVAIRPPGHHCGEDTPCGFCFVNNVAIGAAHAHLNHGIQRIVILDIDLHHGNGTQSIVWQINEETYRQTLEVSEPSETGSRKPGPRIYYGSLHDVLSFPCEDGKPEMVQAASTSIHGPHGQYIENVHLQRYDSEAEFWDVLYPRYLTLIRRARDFLDETGGPGDDVIIFISCGFDAGEHEYPSMSRHHRKVPVGFYHRFTRETCSLADTYARGRVVSVLEGGYSDRALTSGAMAHLCGLVDIVIPPRRPQEPTTTSNPDLTERCVDDAWWSKANLVKLEKAVKLRKSAPARASLDGWLVRTLSLLSTLGDGADATSAQKTSSALGSSTSMGAPPTSMTLRERKKPVLDGAARAGGALPDAVRTGKNGSRNVSTSGKQPAERTTGGNPSRALSESVPKSEPARGKAEAVPPGGMEKKKLPRVILHVRPPDTTG